MVPAHCLPAEAKKKGDCYKKRRWVEGEGGSRRAGRWGGVAERENIKYTQKSRGGGWKGKGKGAAISEVLLCHDNSGIVEAANIKNRLDKPVDAESTVEVVDREEWQGPATLLCCSLLRLG